MNCETCRTWLDAYMDGECPPEQLTDVEEHLRSCSLCAAELLAQTQLKLATRAAAAGHFTPSAEFRQRIESSVHRRRIRLRPFWIPLLGTAAAALLIVLLMVSVRHNSREQEIAELIDLHVATTASANPVDVVSSDRHTVKPWFQGKLPFTFNLPELQGTPFTLVGGRLVYFHDAPAAELLFQLRKHEISAFILQDQPRAPALPGSVRDLSRRGFSLETWTQSGIRYVLVGDASPADLQSLGALLRAAAQ